jgi:hypothetical protein
MSSSMVSAPASAALQDSPDAERVAVPAIARPAAAPSSFAQERLWLVHRLEGGSEAYHIFRAFTLRGALDVAALRHALGETVRRHQALRTVFREVNGRAAQVVAPFSAFPLPVEDLSGLDADARRTDGAWASCTASCRRCTRRG